MAEMPDVVTGEIITDGWGNDIRDRTVQRYTNVTDRSTLHSSPTEGDLAYMEDTNNVWVYNGGSWVKLAPAPVATADIDAAAVTVSKLAAAVGIATGGGDTNNVDTALTTGFADFASVSFSLPADWSTANIQAWGTCGFKISGANAQDTEARVEIGASNGTAVIASTADVVAGGGLGSLAARHQGGVSGTTTVALAMREAVSGDMQHNWSIVQYICDSHRVDVPLFRNRMEGGGITPDVRQSDHGATRDYRLLPDRWDARRPGPFQPGIGPQPRPARSGARYRFPRDLTGVCR